MIHLSRHIVLMAALLLPFSTHAASPNQAITSQSTVVRSCPNRLCPIVKTIPQGTKFTWILFENGYVNITNTTFWVALADIK